MDCLFRKAEKAMRHIIHTYIEFYTRGYDRPGVDTLDITGRTQDADMAAWQAKLLAQTGWDEVSEYKVYERSQVVLDSGEELWGAPRCQSQTIVGELKEIPAAYPYPRSFADIGDAFNKTSLPADWKLEQLQKRHRRFREAREQGCTHYAAARGTIVWLGPKTNNVRVIDRNGGQHWPLPATGAAQPKPPRR